MLLRGSGGVSGKLLFLLADTLLLVVLLSEIARCCGGGQSDRIPYGNPLESRPTHPLYLCMSVICAMMMLVFSWVEPLRGSKFPPYANAPHRGLAKEE